MGCFLIGVTGKGLSRSGEALLGSVSDNPYDMRTFMKAVKPKAALRHIGTELISTTEHSLEERGYFARKEETTRGVNEAGLAFTCAMVIEDPGAPQKAQPAVYADITEFLMQRCRTVAEAIEVFTSQGAVHPPYSVLLADAQGELAHLEVGSFGTQLYHHYTQENPGVVLAVNCYLSQSLVRFNAPNTLITNPDNNNRNRRERGEDLALQFKGELDVLTLANILSDHAHRERDPLKNPIFEGWGYSICNHGTRHQESYPSEDLPWGTVSAEILQPAKQQFWYAYGWPCGQMPEYGDQLFQEKSWGTFVPFGFAAQTEELSILSTPQGEITEAGKRQMC